MSSFKKAEITRGPFDPGGQPETRTGDAMELGFFAWNIKGGMTASNGVLKNPSRYHARTVMPDHKLDPMDHRDADGKLLYRSDPVSAIVDFLMSEKSAQGYQVKADTRRAGSLSPDDINNVAALTEEFLQGAFDRVTAEEKAESGIPPAQSGSLKGAERALVVADGGTLDDLHRVR